MFFSASLDLAIESIFMSLLPAGTLFIICIALSGAGRCPRFMWTLLGLLATCTAGAAFGKIFGWELACTIAAFIIYLVFRWARLRSWCFRSFLSGLITILVFIGFFVLVWIV